MYTEKWTYDYMPVLTVYNCNYSGTVRLIIWVISHYQETLAGKGLKALYTLLANTRDCMLKLKTICQLFDEFVGSPLNYACEVWGFGKSKHIERIHLKFRKLLLKVKSSTCNMGIYGELERYPMYVNRHVRIIKYWCKAVNTYNVKV